MEWQSGDVRSKISSTLKSLKLYLNAIAHVLCFEDDLPYSLHPLFSARNGICIQENGLLVCSYTKFFLANRLAGNSITQIHYSVRKVRILC